MSLSNFLRDSQNSVTRERIFLNRLYFDLKLAAGRRDYALTLFEPEVDRDAYDVVLDDGDVQRRVQLKTVLKSAKTAFWRSTRRFLRLEAACGGRLGLAPLDCGVGGAFIVIEIDDSDELGTVRYFYTDYYIITALHIGLLAETVSRRGMKAFGMPAKDRRDFAQDFFNIIHAGSSKEEIRLPKKLFLRSRDPDSLLSLLGLHSTNPCYLPADRIMDAEHRGFRLGASGRPPPNLGKEVLAFARLAAAELAGAVDEPGLVPFK